LKKGLCKTGGHGGGGPLEGKGGYIIDRNGVGNIKKFPCGWGGAPHYKKFTGGESLSPLGKALKTFLFEQERF